jgi:hypothetical protein
VVNEETMALMSSPEPMPVDVIKALALDGELTGAVPVEVLGETTELIGCTSARYVAQSIGNFAQDLSKRRTK